MKKSWACPKCQSKKVGYLESVHDNSSPSEGGSNKRMIGMQSVGATFGMKAFQATGIIEAFVCTECGYFEEYVHDAASFNWDAIQGFRWCKRS